MPQRGWQDDTREGQATLPLGLGPAARARAPEFVWGHSGAYATRDSNGKITVFQERPPPCPGLACQRARIEAP